MTSLTHSQTFRRLWYKGGRRRSGQVPFLLAERAQSECARSMRAVKGSLTTPYQRGEERIRRASLGLMARFGKSIAKQSEGRAGEEVARSGRSISPHP